VDDPTHTEGPLPSHDSSWTHETGDNDQRTTNASRLARVTARRVCTRSLDDDDDDDDDDGRDDDGRDDDGFVETNERHPTRIRGDGARGRYDERDGRDDDDDGSAVLTTTMTMTMTMTTFRERCARRRRLR